MSELSKLEKLTLIDKRDRELDSIIERSDVSVVYKIMRLSSKYLDSVSKKKISKYCIDTAEALVRKEPSILSDYDNVQFLISQYKRRPIKTSVISLRREEILKFIKSQTFERN